MLSYPYDKHTHNCKSSNRTEGSMSFAVAASFIVVGVLQR